MNNRSKSSESIIDNRSTINETRASIDIGTNSVLLLIAEEKEGELVPVHQEARITRLGQGVKHTGELTDEAQQRTLDALSAYAKTCQRHGAPHIIACGTAALRMAHNARSFIDRAAQETGITIDIISEEREAQLTYAANTASFDSNITVMDIGGGSTEFITADASGTIIPTSLDIGVVALTENFLRADPSTKEELKKLRTHLQEYLGKHLDQIYHTAPGRKLVAAAGTPTALAAMRDEIHPYDPARVHGTKLERDDISHLITLIQPKTIAERHQFKGLQEGRGDVILAGAVLLGEAMKLLGYDHCIVSDRGVRWGMLIEA